VGETDVVECGVQLYRASSVEFLFCEAVSDLIWVDCRVQLGCVGVTLSELTSWLIGYCCWWWWCWWWLWSILPCLC